LRVEAQIHLGRANCRPGQQRGGDEQHERGGRLHADQRRAHAAGSARGAHPRAVSLERRHQVAAGPVPGGCEARSDTGSDGDRGQEKIDPQVGRQVNRHRQLDDCRQRRRAPQRDGEADGAGRQAQRETFGDELSHNAGARRSEREPDADFPLTADRAGQLQVRDVHAGEQHDEADDGKHNGDDECEPPGIRRSGHRSAGWQEPYSGGTIGVLAPAPDRRGHGAELRFRLRDGHGPGFSRYDVDAHR